jgi:hypothetical protein
MRMREGPVPPPTGARFPAQPIAGRSPLAPPPQTPGALVPLQQPLPQFLQGRVPQRPAQSPVPPAPATPQVGSDPFAQHDVQLGKIFANMRAAMKVSRETIARRLATTGHIIEALETGSVSNFPHHRETARIVRGYCELLKLDPEPILWRIRSHYHASGLPMGLLATETTTPTTSHPTQPPVTTQRTGRTRPEGRRRRRRSGRLMVLSVPVALAVTILVLAQAAPQTVYGALSWLPGRVQTPARHSLDVLVTAMAPTRDGLRWIEIDPQLRKGDKLQTSRR